MLDHGQHDEGGTAGLQPNVNRSKVNGKGLAATWDRGVVGQGGGAYILSSVSRLTDKFIDEYLRVNESACSRSPIDPLCWRRGRRLDKT